MNQRIAEILCHYGAENIGVRTNLARILNHGTLGGTGNMVILPVDQGFEHGPARSFAENDEGYDPSYHFQLAFDGTGRRQPAEFLVPAQRRGDDDGSRGRHRHREGAKSFSRQPVSPHIHQDRVWTLFTFSVRRIAIRMFIRYHPFVDPEHLDGF